ncbi:Bug family tripartite tricarboxylate transporter substrate binding protein [Pseudorhodoferax soli]|uniref:Tripartite-type tricarboxylate transporter receptor subunit TctC n=1 Tax=Pseudorhodoferax soli TaxID=545864 RepID=A0A368XB04_9BURK|nr:tripartite tricarboxylate transporter substrate binding protein [Pseudorhodoferax soli]RCW65142.1 tripartite-type tricarboxylate transporter receptor subunit TctC [Pseudorhodoferax soli]
MTRCAQLFIVFLAALGAALPNVGHAEAAWPRETLRVVVPFAPGGLTDVIGRTLAQELAKSLKVPAIVENRSGAFGLVGTEYVAQAKPDGHTLLVGGGIVALADALYPKLRFDPRKDLVPVAMIERNGLLLVATKANERFAGASLPQILGWAREQPGSIAVASFGSGSISHMALETLKTAGRVDLLHVPYRGTAPAMPDVIGGQVPMMIDNTVTALPQVRAGKIHAIAYTGKERLAQLPDVPTFTELGLPQLQIYNFFGLYVPAGTPATVAERLNAEVNRIFRQPEVVAKFAEMGAELHPGSASAFSAFLEGERSRWGQLIRSQGIRPE